MKLHIPSTMVTQINLVLLLGAFWGQGDQGVKGEQGGYGGQGGQWGQGGQGARPKGQQYLTNVQSCYRCNLTDIFISMNLLQMPMVII